MNPTNIRLDEDVLKTSFAFVFRRRLDQDEYVRLSLMSSEDVFKTFSRRLQDVLQKRLQDIFKTFWRRLQDILQRYLQDVFKTYHQVKLFLLTRLWEAFSTFLRRSFPKTVIYRGIYLSNTISDKSMVSVLNLQEINISEVLVFHFTEHFSGRTSTMALSCGNS